MIDFKALEVFYFNNYISNIQLFFQLISKLIFIFLMTIIFYYKNIFNYILLYKNIKLKNNIYTKKIKIYIFN